MGTNLLPEATYYQPNSEIEWIVTKFETIKYNGPSQVFSDKFVPRPDIALVFNFKNIPRVLSQENIRLKDVFIATIPVKPMLLTIDGQIDSFVVICKASVFSRIFKINMVNTIPIIDINDKTILQLKNLLLQSKNDSERIECFEEFIRSVVPSDYKPDYIDSLYNDILNNSTSKPFHQITENSLLSKSSLQRNFLKRTGVSMKKMVRIARVHRILELMIRENQFDFKKIFSDSMYYDQSHFIRDFKEITGLSPMKFFKQHAEILRMISGIEYCTENPVKI